MNNINTNIFGTEPLENQGQDERQGKSKSSTTSGKRDTQAALQSIGERELSILRTLDEIKLCTLTALSRLYFNNEYTARDDVQNLTNLQLLGRVQVDSHLVRQSIGYTAVVKNPVIGLGRAGTSFLSRYLETGVGRRAQPAVSPNLSWSHDLAVSEILSYMVGMARASYEIPAGTLQHRAAVRLYGERHSTVYKDQQITLARREGDDRSAKLKILPQVVVRPDASLLWRIQSGQIDSPYAVQPDSTTNPRWTPTRHSWAGAILHNTPNLQNRAAAEQDGEGWYRWWLIEMETGSNGSAVMRDKIARYQQLRAMLTRRVAYGQACPQILVVVRSNSQIQRQVDLWRKHYNGVMSGAVLITSLEQLHNLHRAGREGILERQCFMDPLNPSGARIISFGRALSLSVSIVG
jgi:hypothetical protein